MQELPLMQKRSLRNMLTWQKLPPRQKLLPRQNLHINQKLPIGHSHKLLAEKNNKNFFIRAFLAVVASTILTLTVFTAKAFAETTIIPGNDTSNISEVAVMQENPGTQLAPNETSALYDLIGVDGSQPLEVILLITVLSVAPSILLMMTSYTRIIIVFSFLRNAMQTQSIPPNQILTSLALFLTIFIMWPVFQQVNTVAYQPYENGEITMQEAIDAAGQPIKTFMLKQTSNRHMKFFLDLADTTIYSPETLGTQNEETIDLDNETEVTLENYQDQLGFEVVIPAFMISELSRAFQMGFMLFIPFLIIDIVVSSTLMALGMIMLPPAMISMPFKLMLFVLVNGWQMLVGTLFTSFNL